jgi:hypothetical protein
MGKTMTNNRLENGTVARNAGFNQVCVWPSTLVGSDHINEFVAFMATEFNGVRIQYLEEIKTKPDVKNGVEVIGTGNRNDVFFAVHDGDIEKFTIPRLAYHIRWIEDVIANDRERSPEYSIYPDYIVHYRTW